MGDDVLLLSDRVLADLGISVKAIADTIERALRREAAGKVWTTPKSAIVPGDGRYMMTTLSTANQPDMTVVKSVMVSPRNPGRGLPGVEGNIMLQDSETGRLRAVMEAGWVTAVRTAGLSVLTARRVANPKAETIAFIGTGVQARSHLDAFSALFPVKKVRVFGRGRPNIDRLCQIAKARGMEAKVCATPKEALEEADLVVSSVTLSFELEPFVDASWLQPGAFAAITDLAAPWFPESLQALDTVIIDDEAQERASPKRMIDPSLIGGDLRRLVSGEIKPAFQPDKRSAFIFRGLAIGDFAIACLAYQQALEAGKGTVMTW